MPESAHNVARILVIDDEAALRRVILRALSAVGYEVCEAAEGTQGLQMFLMHRPDLVICDLFMPGKEGIETIIELRRAAPTIPILAISGGGAAQLTCLLRMTPALGATASLEKPFSTRQLLAAVEELLRGGA